MPLGVRVHPVVGGAAQTEFLAREVAAKAGEQAVGAEDGQTAENSAELEVGGGFEAGGGTVGQTEGGGAALIGADAGNADALGRYGIALAALGFGGWGGGGAGSTGADTSGLGEPTGCNGFAQGRFANPGKPGGGGDTLRVIKQALALSGFFGGKHRRATDGLWLIERTRAAVFELAAPTHQRALCSAQSLLELARSCVAVGHQLLTPEFSP